MTQREVAITVAVQRAYDVMIKSYNTEDERLKQLAKDSYDYMIYTAHYLGFVPHDMDKEHQNEIIRAENYMCNRIFWSEKE